LPGILTVVQVPFHHLSKFFLQQVGSDSSADRNASNDS